MVKKALDSRISTLIKNNVQKRQRSMFVIVGDRGKDQVVNLHWILSQTQVSARPSVLWCYKKELGFSSNRVKRERKLKRDVKKGKREINEADPFELFVSVTDIRYTYYNESHKILGNTYGVCVLQDFEALTPNLLARTIETVEGGGMIVLLLRTMSSLKQLYTMTMDVHSRYRTEANMDVINRFNERFILSLGASDSCLVLDDELNVLPISLAKNIKPLDKDFKKESSLNEKELVELKESLVDTQPIGSLVANAKTLDQGKALLTFVEAISEKTLRNTVTLTAARGRGKSAALGMAISAAVAYGYSNIFVTSPHPDNLKTLFEFIFKGFDALNFSEHLDYDIVQSTNPGFNKAIVRVNIFRQHRQTIQYIQPQDYQTLAQAELLVIDEAAAIPLPVVKKLLGPYLVFMASTINGYEGTGRSLSLKLIQQLRESSRGLSGTPGGVVDRNGEPKPTESGASVGARGLREVKLEEPIRYAPEDPIEKWLNKLLCLDATVVSKTIQGCPDPNLCELYYVHRDTLFSYHPVSETFLQRMMALYVASHYKNTPNDLQLMSDAPGHHLFVLLPPVSSSSTTLPDPLCVVQVSLEGKISHVSVMNSLSRGKRASGDLIPWLVSQQFQDNEFASLSGARVVRIATHPDYTSMGYGARAIKLLGEFYEGKFQNLEEAAPPTLPTLPRVCDEELSNTDLSKDKIQVRDPRKMPPLLLKLSEVPPEPIHYLGVSYGLTQALHKFWHRLDFAPLYVRQTPNDLTGEHTCVMIRPLSLRQDLGTLCASDWMSHFSNDFHRRFLALLGYQFRSFSSVLSLSVLEAAFPASQGAKELTKLDLERDITPFDMKRLESYTNGLLDYHVIMDLVPRIAQFYFRHQLPSVSLSSIQKATLLGMGLQHRTIDTIAAELGLPVSQLLALFTKGIKKVSSGFHNIVTQGLMDEEELEISIKRQSLEDDTNGELVSKETEMQRGTGVEELDDDIDEVDRAKILEVQERQKEILGAMDLEKYNIEGTSSSFKRAFTKANDSQEGPEKDIAPTHKNSTSSKYREGAGLAAKLAGQNTSVITDDNPSTKKYKLAKGARDQTKTFKKKNKK